MASIPSWLRSYRVRRTSRAADSDALLDDMRGFSNRLAFCAIYTGPTLHGSAMAVVTSTRPATDTVPEPSSLSLPLMARAGLFGVRARRKRPA